MLIAKDWKPAEHVRRVSIQVSREPLPALPVCQASTKAAQGREYASYVQKESLPPTTALLDACPVMSVWTHLRAQQCAILLPKAFSSIRREIFRRIRATRTLFAMVGGNCRGPKKISGLTALTQNSPDMSTDVPAHLAGAQMTIEILLTTRLRLRVAFLRD